MLMSGSRPGVLEYRKVCFFSSDCKVSRIFYKDAASRIPIWKSEGFSFEGYLGMGYIHAGRF